MLDDLRRLVELATRGDPERALLCRKALPSLRRRCERRVMRSARETVRKLLRQLGFTRQGNRKAVEGTNHPDAQFEHINAQVKGFLAAGQPVISVDTKE